MDKNTLSAENNMSQAFFTRFYVPPPEKRPRVPQFLYNEETRISLNSPTQFFWCKVESLQGEISKLQATIVRLEKALAASSAENVLLKQNLLKETRPFVQARKPFCELENNRKAHKKAEVKRWLSAQFEKLPSEWKVTEVNFT